MNAPPSPSSARLRLASGSRRGSHHGLSLAVVIFIISVILVLFSKQESAQANAASPKADEMAAAARIKELETENATLRAEIERLRKALPVETRPE